MTSDLAARSADLACSADCTARHDAADTQIGQLTMALQTSRTIGAAVGILMVTRSLTYDRAFAALTMASQARNIKLRVLAESVVYTGSLPG